MCGLGATVRDTHEGFTVMLDPEGNQFCVVEDARAAARNDPTGSAPGAG